MEKIISISFGELFLKGRNRNQFINLAKNNIKKQTKDFNIKNIYSDQGKLFIEVEDGQIKDLISRLQKVFGIAYISPTIKCDKDIESIEEAVSEYIREYASETKTFKIAANRADKSFELKSPEINKIFGGYVLKNFEDLKVDVHNPELELIIDVRKSVYVYGEKYPGAGGLPVSSGGKGLCLLSGGIDSPVASYMMAKRGVEISVVHFHSYPFTSDRSFEKVKSLAEIIASYTPSLKMYNVNLLEIQREINEKCAPKNMTILSRRFMMKIASEICKKYGMKMLVTGESLGQVASQTIEGITATEAVTEFPVFRPLIGMDKDEIIEKAQKINTFETSILPFEDCCTVFQPSNPNIKPLLDELIEEEEKLDKDTLIKKALDELEIIEINSKI